MNLRTATHADLPAIASLHTESWQDAYRGLMPDDFLDGALAGELAAYWAAPRPERAFQIVAEDEGTLSGFVAVTEENGPYIEALHAAPRTRGQGIGTALLRAAARALSDRGDTSVHLTVLTDNTAALALYERLGGIASAPFDDELFGFAFTSRKVRWPDLAPLL